MKKMDQMLNSSSTTLASILTWAKESGYKPFKVVMGNIRIEDFISEIMSSSDSKFFHPIQEIARSEANRLTDILSQMMLADSDIITSIRKGLIQSIHSRLEIKDRTSNDKIHSVGLYNRRLLDKTLRTLISIVSTDRSRVLSHTIRIESVDQTWTVRFTLGEDLLITPLKVNNPLSELEINSKLDSALKGVTFANTIFASRTPDSRRKYHPGDRLTASKGDNSVF